MFTFMRKVFSRDQREYKPVKSNITYTLTNLCLVENELVYVQAHNMMSNIKRKM